MCGFSGVRELNGDTFISSTCLEITSRMNCSITLRGMGADWPVISQVLLLALLEHWSDTRFPPVFRRIHKYFVCWKIKNKAFTDYNHNSTANTVFLIEQCSQKL